MKNPTKQKWRAVRRVKGLKDVNAKPNMNRYLCNYIAGVSGNTG